MMVRAGAVFFSLGLIVSGAMLLSMPRGDAAGAELQLKKQDVGAVEKPKKIQLQPKAAPEKPKKIQLKPKAAPDKPKKAAPKPRKAKRIKPANQPKKLAKPGSGQLRKLPAGPGAGKTPKPAKRAAIKQPGTPNPALRKDLVNPPARPAAKGLKPTDKIPETADTNPLKAGATAGVVDTGGNGLRIAPGAGLKKDLAAPNVKDLAVRPQIREGLDQSLKEDLAGRLEGGSAAGSNLQGLAGNKASSPGQRAGIATRLDGTDNLTARLSDSLSGYSGPDPGGRRAGVSQDSDGGGQNAYVVSFRGEQYAVDDNGNIWTQDGRKLRNYRFVREKLGVDWSDDKMAEKEDAFARKWPKRKVVSNEEWDAIWDLRHTSADSFDEDGNAGDKKGEKPDEQQGEVDPPEIPDWDDEEGDGEWKSGFAGLPYYEYDEDESGSEGSGQTGGSGADGGDGGGSTASSSDDEIEYIWDDDGDSGSSDDESDASSGSEEGSSGDEGDTDVAQEDSSCPEGDEDCGEAGDSEGGDERTVDGDPGNPSSCEEEGADCSNVNPGGESGDGTVRTAGRQEDERGGPLKGDADTSPANGTLRLANEEEVGGELVRGGDALQPAADGTLRLPEGEDDDRGGTPQVAGGSGGGPVGDPGVVTENVQSAGQLGNQEIQINTKELNVDAQALEGVSQQATQ